MSHLWFNSESAQRWLQIARELIDGGTPQTVVAAVYYATACINFEFGDFERTVVDCHRLITMYEELGDPLRTARLKAWEGTALVLLGRVAEGEPLLATALTVARKLSQRSLTAYVLRILAHLSFSRGDVSDGRTKSAEAISIYESLGAEKHAAVVRSVLADGEFACGNVDAAMRLGTSGLIAMRQSGTKPDIALQLVNLAGYCIAAGRWTAARTHALEAVQVAKDFQHHVFFLLALHRVAFLAVLSPSEAKGLADAARLLGYSEASLMRRGYSHESIRQLEYDRALTALREAYAEDELMKHLSDGAEMSSEQAVELALSM